jgi:drug/metabolite transporter (DMT)-like permease
MHPPRRPSVSPVLIIALGILAVSTASIFIRFAQDYAPSIVIAAYRLTFASLVLGPIAWVRHRAELRALTRLDLALGLLSGIFLAIHFATWITSLEYTSVASSVVIVTTTPLWVALLSPLVLRESIGRGVAIGLILSLVGGVTVALSESCTLAGPRFACPGLGTLFQTASALGNILALLGAFSAAGYILIGRSLRAKLSLIPYIFVVYGVAALALIGAMVGFGESAVGYPPVAYLWFLLLGLVPQLLGHSSFNWALGYLPASFVSITLLGEPIGTIILAYLLLNESPAPFEWIGAILILVGIYIASQKPKTINPKEAPMQIRCRNCNRPYALKREEVIAALDTMHTENLKHYDVHCPHCGKNNQVSQKELKRSAPGWSPEQAQPTQ